MCKHTTLCGTTPPPLPKTSFAGPHWLDHQYRLFVVLGAGATLPAIPSTLVKP